MALISTRKKGPVHRKAHVARTGPGQVHLNVLARCRKSFAAARNFRELVTLVREAEKKLTAAGIDDVDDRVTALRGLYYGTEWSTDFLKEKSTTRNLGFRRYTATAFDPPDVRPFLECNLGKALQGSQDCKDAGRLVDFGHLIIGLDSRRKWVSRSYNFAEGGTGLEIVTWLGDLGGGAAMLAKDRVEKPDTLRSVG